MSNSVLAATHNLQVVWMIVQLVLVFVMNDVMRREPADSVFLASYYQMFVNQDAFVSRA